MECCMCIVVLLIPQACVPPNDAPRPTEIGRLCPTKKIVTNLKKYFLVSFLVRIGENPPIWVSHSPTIKDFKKHFFRALNT